MVRLFEGVYIHKRVPGSKLIVSGASAYKDVRPVAAVMADVAREWGVRPEDIVIEAESLDTKDHAMFVKKIVEKDRFVLVTSASHMPRAMGLFKGEGMAPIAAPADYMGRKREGGIKPGDFFPSATELEKVERAAHEYLGMLWGKLRRQM